MLKFKCTVTILNRLAAAHGAENGATIRSWRAVVSLKKSIDGSSFICVSTDQALEAYQYSTKNIMEILKSFLHEGKLTIWFREPGVNLMIRDAPVSLLTRFLEEISPPPGLLEPKAGNGISVLNASNSKLTKAGNPPPRNSEDGSVGVGAKLTTAKRKRLQDLEEANRRKVGATGAASPASLTASASRKSATPSPAAAVSACKSSASTPAIAVAPAAPARSAISISAPPPSKQQKLDSFLVSSVKNGSGNSVGSDKANANTAVPRSSGPVPLKPIEASNIRKTLKTSKTILKIKSKAGYPAHGFEPTLKQIFMNGLFLRRIDSRLARLKELIVLDLAGNGIESIEALMKLGSQLRVLNLADNKINTISDDFFCAESMKGLESLSLARNELYSLPRSIVKLTKLRSLTLTKNNLTSLPYNMHLMGSLTVLALNENELSFLPVPLTFLRLNQLDISDNRNLIHAPAQLVGRARFDTEFVPTLFELAAGFIATHNYKHRGQADKLLPVSAADIPPIAVDMIENCKYCVGCGSLTSRYTIHSTKSVNRAASVIANQYRFSTVDLPTKAIICDPPCSCTCS